VKCLRCCDHSNIADSDDLPLALVFEEVVLLTRLLQSLGRSYIEANEALASVNSLKCCHKTGL